MPQYIEPRHGVVNFLDEAGIEALNTGDRGTTLTLAAQEH